MYPGRNPDVNTRNDDEFRGPINLGPIPRGVPVNLLMNIDPEKTTKLPAAIAGLVRGIVAIEPGSMSPPPYNEPENRLAVWLAHAEDSKRVSAIKQMASALAEAKYPATLRNMGKRTVSLAADELVRIVRWIDMLDRL